ncbi:HET-domain-containing protein [Cryphonectria parasitica EP155]|uniref:HET-domain-containing protein n=1 Tax=Cryphonectria parasitica (strain ATCC 38755 / EP155) TaxID=660469 RepID=A0A9P4Y9Y3_CRYP1|nr:HET-domain-containing protein [Cryphonectria parasitica EP155]KAF3769486.1 HET-domain-containing protein [Cryphonectria parasitica EP155]
MMASLKGPDPYRAVPIDPGKRAIRLVKVQPGSSPPIRCQFISCLLEDCPPYIALSYTWGSSEHKRNIQLQSKTCAVSKNLFAFLCRVSRDANDSFFWIDALCINQSCNRERTHQVRLMKEIYSRACRVIVWLGEAASESYHKTIHLIEATYRELCKSSPDSACSLDLSPTERDNIISLYEHEYWSRVWIVQEVMCARELVIYWGKRTIRWECIARVSDLPAIDRLASSPAAIIIRAKTLWGGSVSLAQLVSTYIHLHSSDIRDKVFGLLGLASEEDPMQADYSMTAEDVFEATCRVAFRSGSLARFYDKVQFGKSLRDALAVPFTDKRLGELARHTTQSWKAKRRNEKVHQRQVQNSINRHSTLGRVHGRAMKSHAPGWRGEKSFSDG